MTQNPSLISSVRKLALILFAGFLAMACQSNPIKNFSKVKMGMEKDQVLEATGGPTRSTRWQGKDRWVYVFKDDETTSVREIHFQDGKVVYAGNEYVPPISAEERDRMNEESNRKAEAERIAENNKSRDKARTFSEQNKFPNDSANSSTPEAGAVQ